MNHRQLIIIVLLLFAKPAVSQDTQFASDKSQPVLLNPAHTGNYTGDFQINNTYRTQWFFVSKPYSTLVVSFDKRIYYHEDIFSLNLAVINDKSGITGLNVNSFYLSESYRKSINGHSTAIGFQIGYIKRHFSPQDLSFPEQFDMSTGYYNSLLNNSEQFIDSWVSYWDMSVGMVWNKRFGNLEPQAGFALYHVNRPEISMNKGSIDYRPNSFSEKISTREVFHADLKYEFSYKFAIHPRVTIMHQGTGNEFLTGIDLYYLAEKNKNELNFIYAGLHMRNGIKRNTDAFVINTGINMNKLTMVLAYEINVSNLKYASRCMGAVEISIVYKAINTRYGSLPNSNYTRF